MAFQSNGEEAKGKAKHMTLLRGVNVSFDECGHLCLDDPCRHGCAVFAPPSKTEFEMKLTALKDDEWPSRAGSYCLGILRAKDIKEIAFPLDDESDLSDLADVSHARAMISSRIFNYCLSTGSFRFSPMLFHQHGQRIFLGSLDKNTSIFMKFSEGSLGFRVGDHGEFTDVTSRMDLSSDLWEGKGKGKWKGWGKGKNASIGPDTLVKLEGVVPVVWLFAGVPSAVKIRLGLPSRPLDHWSKKTLGNMWDDRCFTDCTIECQGQRFEVHRAVLCGSSPLFKSVLSGSWLEANQARFEIKDCDEPLAVVAMLEFMYKGSLLDLTGDVLRALLPLAVQYELDELSLCTADLLLENVTVENVRDTTRILRQFCDHRILAERYSCLVWMLRSDEALLREALV